MTQRPRRLLAALLLGLGLIAAPGPGQLVARAAPGGSSGAVILVGGLCSSVAAGALPVSFTQPGGLVERLRGAGWSDDELITFSYRAAGQPYDCEDTRARTIPDAAALLDAQVRAYAVAHPGAVVDLVGFSQGGLVAVAYLAHLEQTGGWTLPAGARLGAVAALDAPLGGLPFVEAACGLVGDVCAASEPGPPPPSLVDMSTIWNTGTGRTGPANPAGADRSIGRLFGLSLTNQALAETAARRGVTVLTVGNVRDWVYAPIGLLRPVVNFVDTQWLRSGAAGSGVYARVIDSGPLDCPASDPTGASCNHDRVLTDRAALDAVLAALGGGTPAARPSCPAGRGDCITLQPRPTFAISSTIAPGIVTSSSSGFTTSAVRVAPGGRVTVRFVGGAALAGKRVEIWTRNRSGAYARLTSRIADARGSVRFFAPPVTAWTAYQARFNGDLDHGPSVSPGRVAVSS